MEMLNELIAAAQAILDNGFDPQAFLSWEFLSFIVLVSLLGPLHYYTRNFRRLSAERNPIGLLAGKGILEAAKAEITKHGQNSESPVRVSVSRDLVAKYLARLSKFLSRREDFIVAADNPGT